MNARGHRATRLSGVGVGLDGGGSTGLETFKLEEDCEEKKRKGSDS